MQVLCGLQVLFLLFNCQTPEYRWLLEGLSIDQPKAIRPAGRKDF